MPQQRITLRLQAQPAALRAAAARCLVGEKAVAADGHGALKVAVIGCVFVAIWHGVVVGAPAR